MRVVLLRGAFCVVAVWLLLLWHFGLRDDAAAAPTVTPTSFDGDAGFGSLPELLPAADGLWQPPRGGAASARGIVLILHACTHSARDFWKRAPENYPEKFVNFNGKLVRSMKRTVEKTARFGKKMVVFWIGGDSHDA